MSVTELLNELKYHILCNIVVCPEEEEKLCWTHFIMQLFKAKMLNKVWRSI